MYLERFGLAVAPFSITPDPAFAFPSSHHEKAHAVLLQAIEAGDGIVKITGDAGTGKTLACRRLLATLAAPERRISAAYVANPCLTPRTLLLAVAGELTVSPRADAPEHAILALLDRALGMAVAAGRRIVVCFDEAQAMPVDALDALRRLADHEIERRRPLQVVLLGQPELDDKLRRTDLRALASRIASQYRLGALAAPETEAYLAHRLRVAGRESGAAGLFGADVAALLHRYTRGIPRLVNVVAHKALLLAHRDGAPRVGPQHVRCAAADTPYARPATALSRLAAWWQHGRMRDGTPA